MEHLTDIKGPTIYQVTSIAWDPSGRTIFYTADNTAYRDLMAARSAHGPDAPAAADVRIGDLVFNRADKTLWGVRHLNGICTRWCASTPPYTDWKQIVSLPVRHDRCTTSTSRRRPVARGVVRRDQRQAERARPRHAASARRRRDAGRRVRLRRRRARTTSSSRPTAAISTAARTTPARPTSSATRSRRRQVEAVTQRGDRVLPADSARRRRADRVPLYRPGLRAGAHHRDGRSTTSARSRSSGSGRSRNIRCCKTWSVGSPAAIPFDDAAEDAPSAYRLGGGLELESIYPDRPGLQETRRRSGCACSSRTRSRFNRASVAVSYSPAGRSRRPRASACARRLPALRLESARAPGTMRTSTICSDRRRPAARATAWRSAHTTHAGLRRAAPMTLKLRSRAAWPATSISCRNTRTSPVKVEQAARARREAVLHERPVVARPRRRREGTRCGRRWRTATTSTRRCSRACTRTYDAGAALPLGHSSVWLRSAARIFAAVGRRAVREFLSSAASATTTWTTARSSGTASITLFPGAEPQRDRRTQFRARDSSSGTCRRCASAASAHPAPTLAGCGRRCSSSGLAHQSGCEAARVARRRPSAGRSTCGSRCCPRST